MHRSSQAVKADTHIDTVAKMLLVVVNYLRLLLNDKTFLMTNLELDFVTNVRKKVFSNIFARINYERLAMCPYSWSDGLIIFVFMLFLLTDRFSSDAFEREKRQETKNNKKLYEQFPI